MYWIYIIQVDLYGTSPRNRYALFITRWPYESLPSPSVRKTKTNYPRIMCGMCWISKNHSMHTHTRFVGTPVRTRLMKPSSNNYNFSAADCCCPLTWARETFLAPVKYDRRYLISREPFFFSGGGTRRLG